MATVAQLGARALRKVGLAPVSQTERPVISTTVSSALIAGRVLRALGVNPIIAGALPEVAGTTDLPTIGTRALRRLAVVAAYETPTTEDQALAADKASAVHEMLTKRAVVSWAWDAVPTWASEHYVIITAALLAPSFGMETDPAEIGRVTEDMRQLTLHGPHAQTVAEDEVQGVHATLAGLGYAAWDIEHIPEGVAPQYETMALVQLAPAFGKAADWALHAAAADLVRRWVMSGAKGQALAEEKLRAVHQAWEAQGLVRWTLADIPAHVEEPMVWAAAELLAPDVGQPAMAGLGVAAERMIRKFNALPSMRQPVRAEYF